MRNHNNNNICYITIKKEKHDKEANTITTYMKMTCCVCATTTITTYVTVL